MRQWGRGLLLNSRDLVKSYGGKYFKHKVRQGPKSVPKEIYESYSLGDDRAQTRPQAKLVNSNFMTSAMQLADLQPATWNSQKFWGTSRFRAEPSSDCNNASNSSETRFEGTKFKWWILCHLPESTAVFPGWGSCPKGVQLEQQIQVIDSREQHAQHE